MIDCVPSDVTTTLLGPELLRRTFAVDVETCPGCGGRMRLLAVITDLTQVARFRQRAGVSTAGHKLNYLPANGNIRSVLGRINFATISVAQ